MLNKIKEYIPVLLNKLKIGLNNMPKPLKYITLSYILLVLIVLLIYLGCWIYLFAISKAVLSELLSFAQLLIGNSMVTFIAFILGLFIDSNDNGVPDSLEKEPPKDKPTVRR